MDTPEDIRDPPYLRNVGLLLTFHCQARCAHCIIRAGPDRHEEMSAQEARDWIRQIAAYRNHYVIVVSLTGGEPFSNIGLLREVMEFARESNLYVSTVTNGFWGISRRKAKELLKSLPGICFLAISTDLYHQKHVPFERVMNAIWATQECGIPYYVMVVTGNSSDDEFALLTSEIAKLTGPERIRTSITFPVGRASAIASGLKFDLVDQPPRESCQAASSPCIFPDGRVYGCIGPLIDLQHRHPLALGDARRSSLSEIFDKSETNVLLHALRLWGPARLVSILQESGLSHQLPKKYAAGSVCNACYCLLTNPAVRERLSQLEQDPQFRRKVAYGRLYHLREAGMLEVGGDDFR